MLLALAKIQLGSAMRPSELFRMTPGQIDRTGPVWIYRPKTHKTDHHGKT
jgi:integrase